jgi:mannose-6-phosphate isomerase-like protein (cupin superfamily)
VLNKILLFRILKGFKMNLLKCLVLILLFNCTYNLLPQTENSFKFDSTNYTIKNCVNEFSMENIEPTKAGYQYWFADKNFLDGRTIKLSVVAPDSATHPPHQHSEDEFFFVLEGTAEFYLNGEIKSAGPMTSFYCPSYSEHGIRNIGDTELKYLVIKKYDIQ